MRPRHELPVCECQPVCEECGYREDQHPVVISRRLGWERTCYTFVGGLLPDTHYHETHPQTHDSPAEGIEVCEQCGRERA